MVVISLFACSATKHAKKTEPPVTPKTEDKVRVYDPATETYILVPRDAVKVDTIKWAEDPTLPIITDKDTKVDNPDKKVKYDISLLIPFNTDQYFFGDQLDPKLGRFLQYYAGMKIAAAEFEDLGYPVTIHSFDTKNSMTELNTILKEFSVKNSDVIVGPYEKENLEEVATFGLQHDKIVVSPWLPAFSIEKENPFFIQVVPGLSTHAEAIMSFIGDEMKGKKVYLVARNNLNVKTEDLIIDDASVELQRTNLSKLLNDNGSIFILPYYSRSDETFVNSFMRKLHADKELKEVIVFGLPQWTGFTNLNPNYMESLSVHISSTTFVDADHPFYHDFRERFYNEFHTLPDQQAFIGYDLLHWLGKTLAQDGPKGLIGHSSAVDFGLASGFDLKPVYKTDTMKVSEMKTPLYYENSKVRILKYFNQDFTLVR
ncbi:MAG: hypothetical protein ABJB16_06840 [Saprospiraceae bacterium]